MLDFLQNMEWNPLRWAVELRVRLSIFLLRLYAGASFVWIGYQQWKDPNFALNLPSVLMGWAQQNPFFFYEDMLRYIATPNAHIVAFALPILEMFIGTCLILGLFTRWTSLAFLFLTLNFFLAMQHTSTSAAGFNMGFMAVGLILLFSDAGHLFGLDQIIHVVRLRYGWIKQPKRKKKRVKLVPPKPLSSKALPPKLKPVKFKEVTASDKKKSREDREERRVVELPSREKRRASSTDTRIEDTLKKLKERQRLKAVSSGSQRQLRQYDPDELDDEDDDEDDIYAYYGDDDDDDE